jgi:hypothetical protein
MVRIMKPQAAGNRKLPPDWMGWRFELPSPFYQSRDR